MTTVSVVPLSLGDSRPAPAAPIRQQPSHGTRAAHPHAAFAAGPANRAPAPLHGDRG